MKKILALSLLFLYLVCVSGVRITAHYCGGKLKEVSFFQINEKEKCCGKKMKKKNCCKDKIAVLKINDSHKSVHDLKVPNPTCQLANLILPVLTLNFSTHIASADVLMNNQDPPDRNAPDIYLNNGVLLI